MKSPPSVGSDAQRPTNHVCHSDQLLPQRLWSLFVELRDNPTTLALLLTQIDSRIGPPALKRMMQRAREITLLLAGRYLDTSDDQKRRQREPRPLPTRCDNDQ